MGGDEQADAWLQNRYLPGRGRPIPAPLWTPTAVPARRPRGPAPPAHQASLPSTILRALVGPGVGTYGVRVLAPDPDPGLPEAAPGVAPVAATGGSEELVALRREVETLRAGLETSRVIGAAVGLLMAEHRISRVVAFQVLRRLSQDGNVKLWTVAARLVDDADGRSVR